MKSVERELYEMLAEEAAEVIQAVTKILRHGPQSYHPDDPETSNAELLEDEVEEFFAVVRQLEMRNEIVVSKSGEHLDEVWRKKLTWTHHQPRPPLVVGQTIRREVEFIGEVEGTVVDVADGWITVELGKSLRVTFREET